jgi:hypothetical protein
MQTQCACHAQPITFAVMGALANSVHRIAPELNGKA